MAGDPVEPTSRVGVIFVHGIGQQGAFEHVEQGAADLILALREKEPAKRITAGVSTTTDASYSARRETWRAEKAAPVLVDIKDPKDDKFVRVELREVWWADLDEPPSLMNFARFLWWGCTLWFARPYTRSQLPGSSNMFQPRERSNPLPVPGSPDPPVPQGWGDRGKLFFFAMLVLLVLPTWTLLGLLMRLVGFGTIPSARILLQYLGDVKLYGQPTRHGNQLLADLGIPPRFGIRRRFVRAMVDTAMGKYDRWYVVAHSLGSVVAFNGLMETEQSLPNYLDEERWRSWVKHCGDSAPTRIAPDRKPDVDKMWPVRPAWLHDCDAVDRRTLFSRFGGFLTYGSPLDKFAVLFPATVPINKDQYVFPPTSEWINVYEPTDPVGASLDFFGPFRNDPPEDVEEGALTPVNYAVKTWPVTLWSHVTYFRSFMSTSRDRITPLADALQMWIIRGEAFEDAINRADAKVLTSDGGRRFFGTMQILAFFLVTLFLLAGLLPGAVGAFQEGTATAGQLLGAYWPMTSDWPPMQAILTLLASLGGAVARLAGSLVTAAGAFTGWLGSSLSLGELPARTLAVFFVAFAVVFTLGVLRLLFGRNTQR